MKSFVFVSCFVAFAIARPEAGYSYSAPAQLPAPTYSQSAPTSYQRPASGASSYSVGEYSSGGSYSSGSNFADTSANYNSGGTYSSGSGFIGGPSTTVVQKHIYVHVPPPETEHQQTYRAPAVVNQKHYKIIFIKAPSAPSIVPQPVQQAVNEEKTIVYVLVKKPEENLETANVVIPQQPPSKPEVYFIKYKTQGTPSSGGLISGGSAHVGGSHDAISGISYDHTSTHSHGQPSPVYGPAK